ncbi:MAG TPA: capsule biosynthesis protein [Stellaceae bacterium]|nr:capsule biosynthesis protein [Stellaceae bacterium]
MAETELHPSPAEARARPPENRVMPAFWRDLRVQRRVVIALIIREIYSRFGRRNLGFAWIIAEPLTFALPVLGVWSLMRAPFENGLPMVPFLWSGYIPLMLFRHLGGRILMFVRVNSGLLYHRQVTILDLFLGRALLEIMSNLLALFFSAALFLVMGVLKWPPDLPMFYLGYFYMIWWSVAVALIIGGLSERSPEIVEKVWSPISYLYMAVSGFFFLSDWLPLHLRTFALKAMPSIQCYDMIRQGLFGPVVHAHYDLTYMTTVFSVMTLFGLVLIRDSRKYIEIE